MMLTLGFLPFLWSSGGRVLGSLASLFSIMSLVLEEGRLYSVVTHSVDMSTPASHGQHSLGWEDRGKGSPQRL